MIEMKKLKYKGGDKGTPRITEMGNSVRVHTGLWRTHKPVIDYNRCIRCKLCYINCPVTAILWKNGRPEYDYYYCKGCGICPEVCPVKCISMVGECDTK